MCCRTLRPGPARRTVVLLGLAALLATACGKKGDPMPPLRTFPAKTTDLEVRQQGRTILLEMTYPATTVSGLALGGIDAVELLMLAKPATAEGELPEVEPREIEVGARTLLTLSGAELNAAVTGDRVQFRVPLAEEMPEEPVANVFAVRTRKGEEISPLSNPAAIVPREPPPPPGNLQLTPRPNSIEISWEIDEAAAGEIEGFHLFRREAQMRGYGEPIKQVAGDQLKYFDRDARYGRSYIYTVRSLASLEPLIESAEAGEIEIGYEDRFAPPLPENFVALAERGSVRLRWDPSADDDVAGYHLYRREPGRDFHRITEDPVTGTEYFDTGLTSGFSYSYRIQVVDGAGNESPESAPVTTTVR